MYTYLHVRIVVEALKAVRIVVHEYTDAYAWFMFMRLMLMFIFFVRFKFLCVCLHAFVGS